MRRIAHFSMFGGIGGADLAAERLGRTAFGFEIKKEYCKAFEGTISKDIQGVLAI